MTVNEATMQTALTTGRIPLRLDSSAFKNTFPDNTNSNFSFPTYMFKPLHGTWFAHLHSMEFSNSIINIHDVRHENAIEGFAELAKDNRHPWILQIALHRLFAHGLGLQKMYTWTLGSGVAVPALEMSSDVDVLVNEINKNLYRTFIPWSPTVLNNEYLRKNFEVFVYIDNPNANKFPNPSSYRRRIAIAYTNGQELGIGKLPNGKIREQWLNYLRNFRYDRQVWTGRSTKLVYKSKAFTTHTMTVDNEEFTQIKWSGERGDQMSFKIRSINNYLQKILGFQNSTFLEEGIETTEIPYDSEKIRKYPDGKSTLWLLNIRKASLRPSLWTQQVPIVDYHTRVTVKATFPNGIVNERSWKIYPASYSLEDEQTKKKKLLFLIAAPYLSREEPFPPGASFKDVMFQTLSNELFTWCGVGVSKPSDGEGRLLFKLPNETGVESITFTFEGNEAMVVPAFGYARKSNVIQTLKRGESCYSTQAQNLHWFNRAFFDYKYSRLGDLIRVEKLSPVSIRFVWRELSNERIARYSGYSAASISIMDSLSYEKRLVHIGDNIPLKAKRVFNDILFTPTNEPEGFRKNLKFKSEPLIMYKTAHNLFQYPEIFVCENTFLFELGKRTYPNLTKATVEWMGVCAIPAPGSYRNIEFLQKALYAQTIHISKDDKINVDDFLILKMNGKGHCRFEIKGDRFTFLKVTINPTLAYLLGITKEKGNQPEHFTLVSPTATNVPVKGYIADIPLHARRFFTAPLPINLRDNIEHLVVQMPGLLEPSILGESTLPVLSVIPLNQKEGEVVSIDENLPLPILLRAENLSNCSVLLTDTKGKELHLMPDSNPTRMTVVLQK